MAFVANYRSEFDFAAVRALDFGDRITGLAGHFSGYRNRCEIS